MARALLAAMRSFEHAGDRANAAETAVRAARALGAARPNEARALLDHAETLLADADTPTLRELIGALRRELAGGKAEP